MKTDSKTVRGRAWTTSDRRERKALPPRLAIVLWMMLLLVWGESSVHAQCSSRESQRITASDAVGGDQYGYSVSISGDALIVGALFDDANGDFSGSAYISRRNGSSWTEEQKLSSSDGASGDLFGTSVSIRGDVAVVGAPMDDDQGTSSGSAYVFRRSGGVWMEEQKLVASDGGFNDRFGETVDVSDDLAVVGSPGDDDNGSDSGAVYVYRWDGVTWVEEQKLLDFSGASGDRLGSSVAVSGDFAIGGAPGDDDSGSDSGSASVYRWDGASWTQEQKILATGGAVLDRFGISVDIDAGRAIIGADLDDDNGSGSGSAFIYRRQNLTWVEEQKLLASDGVAQDAFGTSVSLHDTTAVVGANLDDDNASDSGSAYVYRRAGTVWFQERKLLASDGASIDQFGQAVSISGENAIVGTNLHDGSGADSGSAYVYSGVSQPGCGSGTVNLGLGPVADVLFVDGSSGGMHRTVRTAVGNGINFSLAAAPAGPTAVPYILWVWLGGPANCRPLVVRGQTLGCTINPIPRNPLATPQPIRCVVGSYVPRVAACGGAGVRQGPPTAPWSLSYSGVPQPAVYSVQGVLQDNGAGNTLQGSLTNAVTLRVE